MELPRIDFRGESSESAGRGRRRAWRIYSGLVDNVTLHIKPGNYDSQASGVSQKLARLAWRSLQCCAVAMVVTGCAGSVVVEFAVDPQLSIVDAAGHTRTAPEDAFTIKALPPGMSVAFPTLDYRSELFDWSIGTGTKGFGGNIANHGTGPLCFRFDQTIVTSNFLDSPTALRIFRIDYFVDGKWHLDSGYRTDRPAYFPQKLCFAPNRSTEFALTPDLLNIFPTRNMFNASWPPGSATGLNLPFRLSTMGDEKS